MRLKQFFVIFLLNLIFSICILSSELAVSAIDDKKSLNELDVKDISLYQGCMLYRQFLQDSEIPYDLEQVIEGMRAADKLGEQLSFDEEKLEGSIARLKKHLVETMQQERLMDANHFMDNIAHQEGVNELERGKLYYKVIAQGSGSKVEEGATPELIYSLATLERGREELLYQIDEPQSVFLNSTITGFAKGVVGMQAGEKRLLYVHPDLAYGSTSSRVKPNSLLIFEIEVIR